MTPATPAYGDAFADVYDDWYPPDATLDATVECLRELAGAGAALELGVGTGRVALALAAAGVPTWGVDDSPAMLARLAAKDPAATVTARLDDMAELAGLTGAPAFALVFAAFNSFFLLTSRESQRRCFHRCAALLPSGGRLVLELYIPARAAPGHDAWDERATVSGGRAVAHRYRLADGDGSVLVGTTGGRPWAMRPVPPAEIDEMATAAGLALEHRWGGWSRERFLAARGHHVSVYRRP